MIITKQVAVDNRKFNVNVEIYDNTEKMVNDLTTRSITDSSFKNMSKEPLTDWEGVSSYQECLDYLKNGYQPVVDKLKTSMKPTVKADAKRISFKNNVVGGMPIVPLAMIGVPNNMIDMQMKPIKAKVIDVYYDITASYTTKSNEIIKAGQKVLETIMLLEQQGYKFNLYAVQTYSDSNSIDMLAIKIKSSNQPIDLKRMSYALTHTSFFRVLGFDWYSKFPKGKYRFAYGHNIAAEFNFDTQRTGEFFKQVFGKNTIALSGQIMHKKHKNDKDAYISKVITAK